MQTWELWYPAAAATGLHFARCRIDHQQSVLVHSAPPVLSVTVSDGDGKISAHGEALEATQKTPMARLTIQGEIIVREDLWPVEADYGSVVLLPGGEAGILRSWWNAGDNTEWRWQVEFYNRND
jgi:hypothetical protein